MTTTDAEISSRQKIMRAAKHLFAATGFDHTPFAAVAAEAGVSEAEAIELFGTKEALLQAIFDEGWKGVSFLFSSSPTHRHPMEELRQTFEMLLKVFERDHELRDLMLFEGRRINPASGTVMVSKGYLGLFDYASGAVSLLLSRSRLRERVTADTVTAGLMGSLEGLVREQAIAERESGESRPTNEEIRVMFEILVVELLSR